ncbi:lipopolysaccharide biosynthesis protein [Taklimakanibacter lacteus]|uniref:lipopolysaccharide biosynthesis protein n=1 Tax=Taklimakanibacter lacteus TaxID=2268456 RepID=UPI0013C4701F
MFRIRLPAKFATYVFVLAARGIYVLMRLAVVLGLPFVLGPAALGQFGTFSALVATLPMLIGLGVSQHVIRRLATTTHAPSFRVLALHTMTGCVAVMVISAIWIRIYPDVDGLTGLLVAMVAGIEVIRAAAYSLSIARSSIIRANIAYVLSVTGPSLAVVAGFLFFQNRINLAIVIACWIVTNIVSTAIALTVVTGDFRRAPQARVRWEALKRRYAVAVASSRNIYLNQIVDVARVYCDRIVVPLFAGFYLAGIYNFFALGANMTVMICNATFGQTDLPQMMKASANQAWAEFDHIVRVGLKRTLVLPVIIMAPLFALKPLAELVLKTTIEASLYYPLTFCAMLVAVSGSVADYLWYAVYAAHGERELAKTALLTVPFALVAVALGTWAFGLIGASLAVALTSAIVSSLRWRRLRDHLAGKTARLTAEFD